MSLLRRNPQGPALPDGYRVGPIQFAIEKILTNLTRLSSERRGRLRINICAAADGGFLSESLRDRGPEGHYS